MTRVITSTQQLWTYYDWFHANQPPVLTFLHLFHGKCIHPTMVCWLCPSSRAYFTSLTHSTVPYCKSSLVFLSQPPSLLLVPSSPCFVPRAFIVQLILQNVYVFVKCNTLTARPALALIDKETNRSNGPSSNACLLFPYNDGSFLES